MLYSMKTCFLLLLQSSQPHIHSPGFLLLLCVVNLKMLRILLFCCLTMVQVLDGVLALSCRMVLLWSLLQLLFTSIVGPLAWLMQLPRSLCRCPLTRLSPWQPLTRCLPELGRAQCLPRLGRLPRRRVRLRRSLPRLGHRPRRRLARPRPLLWMGRCSQRLHRWLLRHLRPRVGVCFHDAPAHVILITCGYACGLPTSHAQ
jgi:hypothetical protein